MMPPGVAGWWTDVKVDETVTSQFVHSHLRPDEAERLTNSVFGDLSDDTYLEWILTRAKRFFLILVDSGVPDQIFGIIDDSYDDENLPVAEEAVPDLRLSYQPNKSLDRRFYRAQFKFLTRVVGDGEHIPYAREETVPVHVLGIKSVVGVKESLDKVKLPSDGSKVFARRRFSLEGRAAEEDILNDIASVKKLSHQHVLSVFGSYRHENDLFVLLSPAADYTLKAFLGDLPKPFESLAKSQRREILLNWPHCIANGLAWLHANGSHHGAVRPSRIQLDEKFQICLGLFEGDGILGLDTSKDDIESYQYAAPERWKRAVTIQSTGSRNVSLPSGGRGGRKLFDGDHASDGSGSTRSAQFESARRSSTYAFVPTSKSNFSRLKLGTAHVNYRPMPAPMRATVESRQSTRTTDSQGTVRGLSDRHRRRGSTSASSVSSGNGRRMTDAGINPIFLAAPEVRTAVVQTWRSAAHDLPAADVFAAGAVILDILTVLCKRGISSFAKHRASKNRQAGRGGGLADASFHANLGQVALWAQQLHKEAEKKIKKDDGAIFKAVGPILQVVMQCLEREPSRRLTAEGLGKKLEEHLSDFARINDYHCTIQLDIEDSEELEEKQPHRNRSEPEATRTMTQSKHVTPRNHSHHHARIDNGSRRDRYVPMSPIHQSSQASLSSHGSYGHTGHETLSETMVDGYISENEYETRYRPRGDPGQDSQRRYAVHVKEEQHRVKGRARRYWDSHEDVDPSFSPSTSSTPGTFNYTSFSASASSITDDDRTSFTNTTGYSPPSTKAPARKLPPAPVQSANNGQHLLRKASSKPPSKSRHPRQNVEEATYQLSQALEIRKHSSRNETAIQNYSHPNAYPPDHSSIDRDDSLPPPLRLVHRSRMSQEGR